MSAHLRILHKMFSTIIYTKCWDLEGDVPLILKVKDLEVAMYTKHCKTIGAPSKKRYDLYIYKF